MRAGFCQSHLPPPCIHYFNETLRQWCTLKNMKFLNVAITHTNTLHSHNCSSARKLSQNITMFPSCRLKYVNFVFLFYFKDDIMSNQTTNYIFHVNASIFLNKFYLRGRTFQQPNSTLQVKMHCLVSGTLVWRYTCRLRDPAPKPQPASFLYHATFLSWRWANRT